MNCLSLPKFKLTTGKPNELAESAACYYHRQVIYLMVTDYRHFKYVLMCTGSNGMKSVTLGMNLWLGGLSPSLDFELTCFTCE